MKRQTLLPLGILSALFPLFALAPIQVAAQDYQMYETEYLRVLPGHQTEFTEALAAHNQAYHGPGAYLASVSYIINGPRTGQYGWVMGPGTFSGLDARPNDEGHTTTWGDGVLSHAVAHNAEYWRLNDNLTYVPAVTSDGARDLQRVRFFEVEDNALFVKVQGQVKAVLEAADSRIPRSMYRKQFASNDGRDWAFVQSYENWTDFDAGPGFNFRETFEQVHGEAAWAPFLEELGMAIVGSTDEWRQRLPELGGESN